MALEFVKSTKDKLKLVVDGYMYVKDKQCENTIYWKCENFRKLSCPCRIVTANNTVTKQSKEHNHSGDSSKIEVIKILNKIKSDALTTCDSPSDIVSNASTSLNLTPAAKCKLPSVDTMKRTIRNHRIKESQSQSPAIPTHRRNIDFISTGNITTRYTTTEKGEDFLLFDSGPVDDRILIFSTRSNLQLLSSSKNWYADGTFHSVPELFEQLYTIHCLCEHTAVPLVYALLPNKTVKCYIQLLRAVKELEPTCNPQTILVDFELEMVNAINVEFPQAIIQGCFFHFCQCVYKNLQTNGLKQNYDTDPEFALSIRMLSALAFVPTQHVVEYFELLCSKNILPADAQILVDYFEDTWIGRPEHHHHRRPPCFPLQMWNCFDTIQHLPKNNNLLQVWHREFQNKVCADLWKFIEAIKREQSLNELRIEQYISGQETAGRKQYKDSTEKLTRAVNSFEPNIQAEDYLREIALHIDY